MKRGIFWTTCIIAALASSSTYADVIYFSDFEADNGGWTGTGDWEWGAPNGFAGAPFGGPEPGSGNSGINVWGTVIGGAHNPSTTSSLSLTIDLTNFTNVTLEYFEWLDSGGNTFDTAEVFVNGNLELLADGGPTGAWRNVVIDMSAYDGQMATVDFLFTTTAVVERVGWYLDDIRIEGTNAVPEPATLSIVGLAGLACAFRRRRA